MTEPVATAETVEKWYGALVEVIDQRREVEAAYGVLVDRVRSAREAGARIDEVAYAAGCSAQTLRRWLTRPAPARIYRQERTPGVVRGMAADARRASA